MFRVSGTGTRGALVYQRWGRTRCALGSPAAPLASRLRAMLVQTDEHGGQSRRVSPHPERGSPHSSAKVPSTKDLARGFHGLRNFPPVASKTHSPWHLVWGENDHPPHSLGIQGMFEGEIFHFVSLLALPGSASLSIVGRTLKTGGGAQKSPCSSDVSPLSRRLSPASSETHSLLQTVPVCPVF